MTSDLPLDRFTDVQQRTLKKGEELAELTRSMELFYQSLHKFTDWLGESERYLNSRKSIPRRFAVFQVLLNQIDEHRSFQTQLEDHREQFLDLTRVAAHLALALSKLESIHMRNSLISVQSRWQRLGTRAAERHADLQKVLQDAKKVTSIDSRSHMWWLVSLERSRSGLSSQISIESKAKFIDKHLCVNVRRDMMCNR